MLAIARSLVMKPKVLLMDEPLANLDVKLKRRILDYIQEIKKQFEISIVYVTHDHREAFSISDQIVVMNKGEIEFQGGVEEVKSSENEFVKYFLEY
jgi:ABC-type Fe3+/spermidine/putrescine transport system ATPase subunit